MRELPASLLANLDVERAAASVRAASFGEADDQGAAIAVTQPTWHRLAQHASAIVIEERERAHPSIRIGGAFAGDHLDMLEAIVLSGTQKTHQLCVGLFLPQAM